MTSLQAQPNTYEDPESVEIMRECVENRRNLGAVTIAKAAERQGANVEWLTRREAWAVFKDRRVSINGNAGTESALASGIEANKNFAKKFMSAAGIPVPAGRLATSADEAAEAQREIGTPVVVKPVSGVMGRGVTVNVSDPADVREAYSRAARGGARVLVEQYIDGESEFRAHATPTECVAVFRRVLPSITGDGRSTVKELVEAKNQARRLNPATRSNPIHLDAVAEGFLRRRDLTIESVVPEGQLVIVRDVNGITSGGDSEECLDSVSDELKRTAVSVVNCIPGMDWGGVDILVERGSGKLYVLEVNTSAAIFGSCFPVYGTPRDLGGILWEKMYQRSVPESVLDPVIPTLREIPETIAHAKRPNRHTVTLRDLLRKELQGRGYQVANHTNNVWSARDTEGAELWFNSVVGDRDLRTAIEPLRKPLLVQQIMRDAGIPVPAGDRIESIDELQAFRDEVGTAVTALPFRMSPHNPLPRVIEHHQPLDDSILPSRRARLVQSRPQGHRFSVIATPEEAVAVIADPDQPQPRERVLAEVSELAVRAVRAVPQLRWATVSIVWPTTEQGEIDSPGPLVEVVTINSKLNPASEVIAGSMHAIFDMLIK